MLRSRHRPVWLWLMGLFSVFAVTGGEPVLAQTAPLKVTEWVSKSGPLFDRSGIIEGPTEIGLVDTQFTNANVHRLIADLIESGKPLRWVYVTHPHVDHFNGATLLRTAFPDAKFYAQASAIPLFAGMVAERQAGLGAAAPGGAPNVTAPAPTFFEPVPGAGLKVDGQPIEIIRGFGDHPDSSVVWVRSAKTVITGDVVFSHTHAFTGDHDDIPGWIALVKEIQALKPDRVVVGHAAPDVRRDASVLDEQIRWLEDYSAARAKDPSADAIKKAMTAKYPDYANDFIFVFSEGVRKH
jgi:glyoxylase-like metal-dependent hydrolase (beta-lactamase superfamily II)